MPVHPEQSGKGKIALIGMRGCGKSSVGHILARLLDTTMVDTDDLIIEKTGRSIAEIFSSDGKVAFRDLESEAVAVAAASDAGVVSVGGGAILRRQNVDRVRSVATVIWLTAPPAVLWERIHRDEQTATHRPALTNRDGLTELEILLNQREACYRSASDIILDAASLDAERLARQIVAQLSP